MGRITALLFILFFTPFAFAQKDVTTFLGIPVDGSKAEMRAKLIAKSFVPKTLGDGDEILEGEFNGRDVQVSIVTNNNKVYRIMLLDKHASDEAQIKIQYNNLVAQFERNSRYVTFENYRIPEDVDISYEMLVHNQTFGAHYFQKPDATLEDTSDFERLLAEELLTFFTEEQLSNPTEDILKDIQKKRKGIAYRVTMKILKNKSVWFRITQDGGYRIAMYYDNCYNKANGEDL